jgi:hypothetical protein
MPLWRAALIIHFVFPSFPFFLNALNLILNPHRAVDPAMSAGILPALMSAGFQPASPAQWAGEEG